MKKIIAFITFLAMTFTLSAKPNKTYSGPFSIVALNWFNGNAKYSYYTENDSVIVYDGHFRFTKDEAGYKYLAEGNFKENSQVGKWLFRIESPSGQKELDVTLTFSDEPHGAFSGPFNIDNKTIGNLHGSSFSGTVTHESYGEKMTMHYDDFGKPQKIWTIKSGNLPTVYFDVDQRSWYCIDGATGQKVPTVFGHFIQFKDLKLDQYILIGGLKDAILPEDCYVPVKVTELMIVDDADIKTIDELELAQTAYGAKDFDDYNLTVNELDAVDEYPEFPGGQEAMYNFLAQTIRYPEMAAQHNKQGRVIVKFVIEKDGSIGPTSILRSADPDLDQEAIRVIKLMPKWSPGKMNGKPVRVWFTLPINFKLPKPSVEKKE